MWKRSIAAWIAITAVVNWTPGQTPDSYDTLFTRSNKMVLCPKYDTIKQLEKLDEKTDTLIEQLKIIAEKLDIKDTIQ